MTQENDYSRLVVIKCQNGVAVITDCPKEWSDERIKEFQDYIALKNDEVVKAGRDVLVIGGSI